MSDSLSSPREADTPDTARAVEELIEQLTLGICGRLSGDERATVSELTLLQAADELARRSTVAQNMLSDLEDYIRHNAVLPSDFLGDGRVVSLSKLRGWIHRTRAKEAR